MLVTTSFAALAAASLVCINSAQAQFVVQAFDTSASVPDSLGGGLSGTATEVWDGTVNGPNDPTPGSGSLYVTLPNTAATPGWNELQLGWTMNVTMGTYINCEFDYKIDEASSATNSGGNYGGSYPVIQSWTTGSPGWDQLNAVTLKGGGWHHYSGSLASFSGQMTRLNVDLNTGPGSFGNSSSTKGVSMWIDDIVFTSPALPPPTLGAPIPAPRNAGLTLLPASTGQYQRVMLYPNALLGTSWGWYGVATAGNPVSYSFTITNFPDLGRYTAQVFWIPANAFQYSAADTSVDWNCTNDLVFTVSSSNNTGASTNWNVTMAAKTNSPGHLGNGNPNLTITNFNYGKLPVGKWTVTFTDNTDFTITAPDGTVKAASLPSDVAGIVSGNTAGGTTSEVFIGVQPNDPQGIGAPTVLSDIQISGTPTTINDSFSLGYLDTTNTWTVLADAPVGVTVNSGNLAWYVPWNTPNDSGYSTLLAASSMTGPWLDLEPPSNWLLINGTRKAVVTTNDLQNVLGEQSKAFFRLLKRQFSQLQILLPGETNAPNTTTGKVGTPATAAVNGAYNVTINAVDSTYHMVNSADALTITTTDGTATILTPTPNLVGGTVTVPVYFGTAGTYTVTATDTTSTNIPPATSESITAQ